MFRALLFLICFLSLVVPRSGTKIGPVPIAIPSLLFVLLMGLWVLIDVIGRRRLPRTAVTVPVLVYLLWASGAFIRGIRSAELVWLVIVTSAFVLFPLVFFLMTTYINTSRHLRLFLNMILVSLIIVCCYGFAQFLLGFQKVTIPGLTMSYFDFFEPEILNIKRNVIPAGPTGQKMFSTFHNGNIFGQHLVTFIPLIIVMFFEVKTAAGRLLSLAAGLLSTAALVCALSRGAVAGFLISIIFLFLIARRKQMKIFCIAILLLAVLSAIVFGLKFRYVDQLIAEPTGTRWESLWDRIIMISPLEEGAMIRLILFGIGLGGNVLGVEWFYSTYMTIWLDMGIIGLGLFLWIIFMILRKSLLRVQLAKEPVVRVFLVGGTAGILGAMVHMSVDTLFIFPPIAQNFWMFIGLIAAAIKLAPAQRRESQ